MKKFYIIFLFAFSVMTATAQEKKYSDHYYERVAQFESETPICSNDIVFLGNSLTEGGKWNDYFAGTESKLNKKGGAIRNRGIIGDTAEGIADRLDEITKGAPKKIFLLCGVNDISHNLTVDEVVLGEYPYVQRGNIIVSKDLLGESGVVLHENWMGATPAHVYTDAAVNTVSASFEVAETDCEDGTTFTWGEAATKCSEIGPGWRVPTAAELLLMRDCKSQLETSGALSGAYWSATEVTTVGGDDAVAVDADDKIKEVQAAKNDPHKVRCVRDI